MSDYSAEAIMQKFSPLANSVALLNEPNTAFRLNKNVEESNYWIEKWESGKFQAGAEIDTGAVYDNHGFTLPANEKYYIEGDMKNGINYLEYEYKDDIFIDNNGDQIWDTTGKLLEGIIGDAIAWDDNNDGQVDWYELVTKENSKENSNNLIKIIGGNKTNKKDDVNVVKIVNPEYTKGTTLKDYNNDNIADEIMSWEYDEDNNLKEYYDWNGDNTIDEIVYVTYNENRTGGSIHYDYDADDIFDEILECE